MHAHYLEDAHGNLTDAIPFCSDSCHREWCRNASVDYNGWNGAHDSGDSNEYCANCGTIAGVGEESCECQESNVIVNRFTTEAGEMCEHGNWIQLPRAMTGKDY